MLIKLSTKFPKIVFKGIEDDFYSKNHCIEIENIVIEFRYSQFYKNRLEDLKTELSCIMENDHVIKYENNVFHNIVGFFNNSIFYLKKNIGESEYFILITFSESQPGIFWIGIESIWKYNLNQLKA